MGYVAEKFDVPLVPWAEWVDRLEKLEASTSENGNAALRLLGFYKTVGAESLDNRDAGGTVRCDMSVAISETTVLDPENLSGIGSGDVKKWLDFWESIGCMSYPEA